MRFAKTGIEFCKYTGSSSVFGWVCAAHFCFCLFCDFLFLSVSSVPNVAIVRSYLSLEFSVTFVCSGCLSKGKQSLQCLVLLHYI
jgi:hypothetical protein